MQNPQPAHASEPPRTAQVASFLKTTWRDYLFLLTLGGAIILLDQWTKYLVRQYIPLGGEWLPRGWFLLLPYFRVLHSLNTGAAFGIFQNGNLVFMLLAILVAGLILYYFPRVGRQDVWMRIALAMQFAGAVGNMIDRILAGHVTDFISVGNFAIFNLADASISVGVVILVVDVWWQEQAEKHARHDQQGEKESTDQDGHGSQGG
jgi:signal peptidase II